VAVNPCGLQAKKTKFSRARCEVPKQPNLDLKFTLPPHGSWTTLKFDHLYFGFFSIKPNGFLLVFISPFMYLTGFSLGIHFFHFEDIPLSALKYRFQATHLHIFGLVGKILARRWFLLPF
jgi:hypothetical protein